MNKKLMTTVLFLFPVAGLAFQASQTPQQNIVILESRLDDTCSTISDHCFPTQHLIAKVGERKIELRKYESRREALLKLGTYSAKLVQDKPTQSYRLNESYILTYPDGKTEKFDLVGLLP